MKIIGFDPGNWDLLELAKRISGLLGMEQIAYEKDTGGYQVGAGNDYWLYKSMERAHDGVWELHARYDHTLRENGVQEALLVLMKQRLYLKNVFIIG